MTRFSTLLLASITTTSFADYREPDNGNVNVTSNPSMTVTGDRAYGIGGLGGVEINDCLASYQVAFFWQSAKLNPWCAADQLDKMGRHDAAAQMRCSMRRVRRVYGDECIQMLTQASEEPPPQPEVVREVVRVELPEEVVSTVSGHAETLTGLETRLDQIESQRLASVRASQAESQRRRDSYQAFEAQLSAQ